MSRAAIVPALKRGASAIALAALCAGLPTGCGSTVAGEAMKGAEPGGSGGVDVALLDTGPYATHAGHPFGKADGVAGMGAYLEAIRMAEFVVGPWEVDATLSEQGLPTGPLASTAALNIEQWPGVSDVAGAHGFITAFATTRGMRGDAAAKGLLNIVMRFPDADAAAAAATEMAATARQTPDPPRAPTSVPRHPEAYAVSLNDDLKGFEVESYAAHGPFVLYQFASTKDRPEVAGQIIANTLDAQVPRIDDFTPTDQAKLADLPLDPTGQLLARTLGPPKGEVALPTAGGYEPHAELHFEYDPAESGQLFTVAGVEMVAQRWNTRVYQTHDTAGAARVVNNFVLHSGSKPTPGINGLPDAKCFDLGVDAGPNRFVCLAAADRYAFIALAGQETAAKQMAAAQYRILAGK